MLRAALPLALCLVPSGATAHSPIPGFAGFYTGLLHPLSTAGQCLALLALGLMLGLRWPERFAICWLAFAICMLAGISVGQLGAVPAWGEGATLLLAGSVAALSALFPAGHLVLFLILSGAGGFAIGVLSTPDPGPLQATIITLAGSFVGANLALVYISAGIGWLRRKSSSQIPPIAIRVASAWIAAIALLLALLTFAAQRL